MTSQQAAREALAVREIISSLAAIAGIFLGMAFAIALSWLRLRGDWALAGLPLTAALWLAGSPFVLASVSATVTALAFALISWLVDRSDQRGAERRGREEIGPLQLALAFLHWRRPADPFRPTRD